MQIQPPGGETPLPRGPRATAGHSLGRCGDEPSCPSLKARGQAFRTGPGLGDPVLAAFTCGSACGWLGGLLPACALLQQGRPVGRRGLFSEQRPPPQAAPRRSPPLATRPVTSPVAGESVASALARASAAGRATSSCTLGSWFRLGGGYSRTPPRGGGRGVGTCTQDCLWRVRHRHGGPANVVQ